MRTLTKITITTTLATIALVLSITASMFATPYAAFGVNYDINTQVSSLRITQSTEDGLEVECKGNLKCEMIGDDTVVATSGDNATTSTTATITTILNQSNIIPFGKNDFDVIEKQDLGAKIEGLVDRVLDGVFA